MRSRADSRARSATCAAFRSCVGVSSDRPRSKSSAAVSALAAFRLKSPIRSGCGRSRSASAGRWSAPGSGSRSSAGNRRCALRRASARAGWPPAAASPAASHALERGPQPVEIEIVERDAGGPELDAPRPVARACAPAGAACGARSRRLAPLRCDGACGAGRESRAARTRSCASCKLLHRLAAQLIQQRTRGEGRAFDFQFNSRQLVRRIAQPAELRAQILLVERRDSAPCPAALGRLAPSTLRVADASTRSAAARLRAPSTRTSHRLLAHAARRPR